MKSLFDLLVTLLFYIFLTTSCLGWGHYMGKLLGLKWKASPLYLGEIWIGWCGVVFLLQVVHCLVPLNICPSAIIYGIGLVLLLRAFLMRGVVIPWEDLAELGKTCQIGLLFFAIWLAMQAMKTPLDYDNGLYHFTAIRWINEYAIVPGLGNLHGRLAFNYAYFLFVASLNFFPWFNHGHNVALSWLALLTTVECLFYFHRVLLAFRRRDKPSLTDIIPAVLLPYLLYAIGQMDLSSPQVDHIICLMRIMIFMYFWRNLASKDKLERNESTKVLIILGVTSVTLKLSILFFPIIICLITITRCYLDQKHKIRSLVGELLRPALFAVLTLIVWMGRGIITSGYPAYPSTFLAIHTDWTIPLVVAKDMQSWIYSWGRWPFNTPDVVLKNSAWVGHWLADVWNTETLNVVTPMIISLVTFPIIIVSLIKKIISRQLISPLYLGILPILAGLIAWFVLVPTPRYADGLFWLLPLACLSAYILSQSSLQSSLAGTTILFILMYIPLLFQDPASISRHFAFSGNGWQPIQSAAIEEKTTRHGLKVYIPVTGYQCWDAPLPNSPYFYTELELRGSGLQSGFKSSLGLLNGGAASEETHP